MDLEKIIDQSKNWLGDRLKSPYFGSVIAVWIFTNRKVVFSIFNFEEGLSIDHKVDWIHKQFELFKPLPFISWFHGFEASVIWAFILGFIVMIFYNKISGFGEAVYKLTDRSTINFLQKIEPSKWVERDKFSKLEELFLLSEKANKEKNIEISRLEKEQESALIKLTENKKHIAEQNTLLEQYKTELDNNKNVVKQKEKDLEELEKKRLDQELKLKKQTSNSMSNRTAAIQELRLLIQRDKVAPSSEQWIHNQTCLVHDFLIENKYEIAVDTHRYEDKWEIQVFGRNIEASNYLFNAILNTDFFLPKSLSLYEIRNNRLIYKEYSSEVNISYVAEGLNDIIARLEVYRKIKKEKK